MLPLGHKEQREFQKIIPKRLKRCPDLSEMSGELSKIPIGSCEGRRSQQESDVLTAHFTHQ
jgi:hypothetical protein